MGSPTSKQWTSGTGEFVAYDYTDDFASIVTAIGFLTTAINDLTAALETQMIGPTASTVQGSVANSALNTSRFIQAIGGLEVDGSKKKTDGLAALGVIASQLAGISSTIATGVATNQIIAADQIKKNAFDKEATQAALTRNNLPTVTVTPAGFLESVRTSVADAGSIAAQASATGFVTSTAATAIGTAGNYVYDLLPSFGQISNGFKNIFQAKAADPEGNTSRSLAETRLIRT